MEAVKEKEISKEKSPKETIPGWAVMAILNAAEEFMAAAKDQKAKIPVKVAYTMSWNMNKLVPIVKKIENQRYKILEEAGVDLSKLNPGQTPELNEEQNTAANEKFNMVMQEHHKVNFRKIKVDQFEDMTLDFSELQQIGYLFDYLIEA